MATKKKAAKKRKIARRKPVKKAKKNTLANPTPAPNPFDGSAALTLIKQPPRPVIEVDAYGVIRKLVVDKSGLTSYWDVIGEQGPLGNKPPEPGNISDEMANKIRNGHPTDGDSLLARSAASVVASNLVFNAGLFARYASKFNDWRKGQGKEPKGPLPPTFNAAEFVPGVNHYRPVDFNEVYDWMVTHHSGSNPDSAAAAIPIPPEYDYQ